MRVVKDARPRCTLDSGSIAAVAAASAAAFLIADRPAGAAAEGWSAESECGPFARVRDVLSPPPKEPSKATERASVMVPPTPSHAAFASSRARGLFADAIHSSTQALAAPGLRLSSAARTAACRMPR